MTHRFLLLIALFATFNAEDIQELSLASIDSYLFAPIPLTKDIDGRSGAVIGSNSDMSRVFVLGGDGDAGATTENYFYDVAARTWNNMIVQFSRIGSCYAQDSTRKGIWIYGGEASGNNSDPFLAFNTDTQIFTNMTKPTSVLNGVSCAVTDSGKFYTLFGGDKASFEFSEQFVDCSATINVYDSATKNWTVLSAPNGLPKGRVGSVSLIYKNSIVVFGGMCATEFFDDLSFLDLTSNNWTSGTPLTGLGRAYASAFIVQDTLYVFGGIDASGALSDAYSYDFGNKTWTAINTSSTHPESRYSASVVTLTNRALIFGGQNGETRIADAYQFVLEKACLTRGCEDCTSTAGCGWCSASAQCVAGDSAAFVTSSCNSTSNYVVDLDSCPEVFPSYAIALLVIGGVVVVGITIFAIMKVRSGGDEKDSYERIA